MYTISDKNNNDSYDNINIKGPKYLLKYDGFMQTSLSSFKSGDRIKLLFDFIQSEIKIFHNDNYIDVKIKFLCLMMNMKV